MIAMHVRQIALDQSHNPVLLLVDEPEARVLPIWVGSVEAHAIALAMHGLHPDRPLTHDLLVSAFESTGVTVSKVVISDLRDGTFFAEVHLEHLREPSILDARPSDAIALALRCRAPIYITARVAQETLDVCDLINQMENGDPADDQQPDKKILH